MRKFIAATVSVLSLVLVSSAFAESVLWTVPSTDIMEAEKLYLELDTVLAPGDYTGGVRSIYGLSDRIEIGANLFGSWTEAPLPDQAQLSFKYRLWDNADLGYSLAAGANLNLPVRFRDLDDTFGMLYLVGSKKFAGAYGPRLTLGLWTLVFKDGNSGSLYGLMVGLEQPITDRLAFVVDHMTGDQSQPGFSSTTAGLMYAVNEKTSVALGYMAPNYDLGDGGAIAWVGFKF